MIISLLLLFEILLCASASSHGSPRGYRSRRYAAYDYDLTTPQFTPDGRLLQVEYATNACVREDSNPIVSVGIRLPGVGETVLIMATISSPPLSSTESLSTMKVKPFDGGGGGATDRQGELQDEYEINLLMKEKHQRAQFRIIEVPLSSREASFQHSTMLVGLSGLLSDATTLLQVIYSHLEQEQRMMGWHRLGSSPVGISVIDENLRGSATQCQSIFTQPSETVLRLSRALAAECQKHAFGGGLRPLGASLLLAGVDSCPYNINENSKTNQRRGARVAMCETHPNGGWRNSLSSVRDEFKIIGHSETKGPGLSSPQIMISGGSVQSQRRLKISLRDRLRINMPIGVSNHPTNISHGIHKNCTVETLYLRKVLQTITSSLVDEWQNRGDHRIKSSGIAESGRHYSTLPQMEVVIASSNRGTHRLTEDDVARILKPN